MRPPFQVEKKEVAAKFEITVKKRLKRFKREGYFGYFFTYPDLIFFIELGEKTGGGGGGGGGIPISSYVTVPVKRVLVAHLFKIELLLPRVGFELQNALHI